MFCIANRRSQAVTTLVSDRLTTLVISSSGNIVDGAFFAHSAHAVRVNKIEAKRRVSFISHIARKAAVGRSRGIAETRARMTEQPGNTVGGPACHNACHPQSFFTGDWKPSPLASTVSRDQLVAVRFRLSDKKRRRLGHVRIAS